MAQYQTRKSGAAARSRTIAQRQARAFKRGIPAVTRSGRAMAPRTGAQAPAGTGGPYAAVRPSESR